MARYVAILKVKVFVDTKKDSDAVEDAINECDYNFTFQDNDTVITDTEIASIQDIQKLED